MVQPMASKNRLTEALPDKKDFINESLGSVKQTQQKLDGGISNIFYFHPYLGKMNPFWLIFFKGVETTN